MSSDVARGVYSSSKKSSKIDSKRNLHNSADPVLSTTVTLQAIDKYAERNHSAKSLEGAKYKDRPNTSKNNKKFKDKKAEAQLRRHDEKRVAAAVMAAEAEILDTEVGGFIETENEMERTHKLKQTELSSHVDEQTSDQIYDLSLTSYSPYNVTYDRPGRHLLLTGRTGHVAIMDALTRTLQRELFLTDNGKELNDIRSSTFLHNSSMFALAEKKHVFIYDSVTGAEVHRLGDHIDPLAIDYLPYHWLLASVGRAGFLKYTDTSTGDKVSEHRTKLGPCSVMRHNPYNAVMHLGHGNGVVTMWSPSVSQPLVKILAHRGPVVSLANDLGGNFMVTAGSDMQVKVWDVRTFKVVHSYFSRRAVCDLDISQTGVLAVGSGTDVTFWKDAIREKQKEPYMKHRVLNGGVQVKGVRFRPFEDVVGIGHSKGFSSIVVPGVGSSNYDSFENNMFADKKQRQEQEVRSLMDKLRPEMIQLNPEEIGGVERDKKNVMMEKRELAASADQKPKKEKKKARGRNKISKKLARKHANIMDEGKKKLMEKKRSEAESKGRGDDFMSPAEKKRKKGLEEGGALSRFFK